jgi:hypothetical protein
MLRYTVTHTFPYLMVLLQTAYTRLVYSTVIAIFSLHPHLRVHG